MINLIFIKDTRLENDYKDKNIMNEDGKFRFLSEVIEENEPEPSLGSFICIESFLKDISKILEEGSILIYTEMGYFESREIWDGTSYVIDNKGTEKHVNLTDIYKIAFDSFGEENVNISKDQQSYMDNLNLW